MSLACALVSSLHVILLVPASVSVRGGSNEYTCGERPVNTELFVNDSGTHAVQCTNCTQCSAFEYMTVDCRAGGSDVTVDRQCKACPANSRGIHVDGKYASNCTCTGLNVINYGDPVGSLTTEHACNECALGSYKNTNNECVECSSECDLTTQYE